MGRLQRWGGQSAQSMVEFALILPVFLLLIFGSLDLGRAIFYQSLVNNAVRDGARYAIVHPDATCASSSSCGTTSRVQASAQIIAPSLTICSATFYSSAIVSSSPPACPNSATTQDVYGYVTVVASMPFQPLTNLFGSNWSLTLRAQSTMLFQP